MDTPQSLGPFEILSTVASDTHTLTLRARKGPLAPSVLLRIARPGIANATAVASLLEREAERYFSLCHRALPTVIEVAELDGSMALVLVDRGGVRLDTLLARVGQLELGAAVAIAVELAGALGAFHKKGAVFAAIRASEVELTDGGGVYLHGAGDLGPVPGVRSALTAPEHLAPEQVVGELPDARSDVFLLGTLLYRCLAGRGPFDGDGDGLSQRLRHRPHTPLALALGGPGRTLEHIVDRCLAKRPADRFADMASVGARLTQVLRSATSLPTDQLVARALADAGLGEPYAAPLDPGADRCAARSPSRPALLAAAGVAATVAIGLALALGLGDSSGSAGEGPRGLVEQPARLRVLARPWAEVHVDGKHVETTPFARALELTPGRHTIVMHHPNAPDELRGIEVSAGQTLLLDVEMGVARPRPAASAAARAAVDDP